MKRITACAALALTACATNPAAIAPRPTDYRQFMVYSCSELTAKAAATDAELRRYVHSQSNARAADAVTWPVSTSRIFGKNRRNVEAISRLGGELDAMRRAQALRCEQQ